ncbi:ATP synthase F1 subunit delta [Sulfobacillus sp. hq2]|uniref:ATP synthase subunit delta n=1 Tax=Sulfobacillus thermotolerans TaxID=338644 RepID=A0ABM6RTU6_9FIRM|nr:ATP synthase F1 subunit delta [Sulfobacillus sp. hq2]AUW94746.1 ATP synthase F1 subunit delta [Sulfobacillus thermotolerans]MCY0908019.1 ATP synthase F1 subunit delta [Sulfobacillus thermotolerans]POB09755.1 ATP synthase F1 subunit delta [Sulfobacillus sp. hq2]
MIDARAARPYARALFGLADDTKSVERVHTEFREVVDTLNDHPDLQGFLHHPQVSHHAKKETLHRVFGSRVSPVILHFLNVVVDKDRQELLPAIYDEFTALVEDSRGILEAHVETASALSAEQKQMFAEKLGRATGRNVVIVAHENPALMAGAIIRIGDRVLDGSLRRRMELLGARLRGNGGGLVVEH